MINEEAIKAYLRGQFSGVGRITVRKLGSGVQGSGFLVELTAAEETRSYVVKRLLSDGLGHEYPSDRAAVFILDLDEYGNLPKHVRAIDVLAEMEDGTVRPIGGGREYYLLMEKGEGTDYFNDLRELSGKKGLGAGDRKRIAAMALYLAEIHSAKKASKALYWRKLRDTVGHGECLMGVFDTYPEGIVTYGEMADIEKKCVDWRARLKPFYARLSQIHGDFHPGNIWFGKDDDFIVLDRSRGPWGEPADDVTALAINYIFFSVRNHGDVRDAYFEGLQFFFDEYVRLTGDSEIRGVVAPFFAFRAAVVANPVFYPDLSKNAREKIIHFARAVLSVERFETEGVNEYLKS